MLGGIILRFVRLSLIQDQYHSINVGSRTPFSKLDITLGTVYTHATSCSHRVVIESKLLRFRDFNATH